VSVRVKHQWICRVCKSESPWVEGEKAGAKSDRQAERHTKDTGHPTVAYMVPFKR